VGLKQRGKEAGSEDGIDAAFEWASYGRSCLGERVSGDVALAVAIEQKLLVVLIDVLGHGTEANALAVEMNEYVTNHPIAEPLEMILKLHERFKGSRGSAVGLAVLDTRTSDIAFAGVGNPSFRVLGPSRSVMLPVSAGIIGGQMRSPVVHHAQLNAGELLVGCSDGVAEGFQLKDYPQMFSHGTWAVARTIVHRFGKDYDDATCVVARRRKS
jgi:serine phosphatase RsbU (regulator of sigma subunit)